MSLRISHTGIRPGEFIRGVGKQCAGTIMEIIGTYPASLSWFNQLPTSTIRDEFNQFKFFQSLTFEERRQAILDNSTENSDLYLEDCPGLRLKFVRIGGEFFTSSLSESVLTSLVQGNSDTADGAWDITEIYQMFPRKPGSKARKHTLIFRPNNWTLCESIPAPTSYTGPYFCLETQQFVIGSINISPDQRLDVFPGHSSTGPMPELVFNPTEPSIAIFSVRASSTPLNRARIQHLASTYVSPIQFNIIAELIEWFSPSIHKSLIQKCIRIGSQSIEYSGRFYPTSEVLIVSLALLMIHPGAFVPNIQRFVSGLESATKRLAVSIHEDSWIESPSTLTELYASALIAQSDRTWIPSDQQIQQWFKVAIESYDSEQMYQYNFHECHGINCINNSSDLSYWLLKRLKSFESDIRMVASIAENNNQPRPDLTPVRPIQVPLIHCIDHHSLTGIAYFFPIGLTIPDRLKQIWTTTTGINFRRSQLIESDIIDVRYAQRWSWIQQLYAPSLRPTLESTESIRYTLDPSWLAGLIGPIEIKLGSMSIVGVIRTDDIHRIHVIRRPRRDENNLADLTEAEKSQAIDRVEAELSRGIRLKSPPSTLPGLTHGIIRRVDDEYLLIAGSASIRWLDYCQMNLAFPHHAPSSIPTWRHAIEQSLISTGYGIEIGAYDRWNAIISQYPSEVVRRLRMYLSGFDSTINLYKISRDGSGVDYAVSEADIGVNQLLSVICVLFPVALHRVKSGFRVGFGPVLWGLRDHLATSRTGPTEVGVSKWTTIPGDGRRLWEHQSDSVASLITRHQRGMTGHGLWLPVGCGKTLIVMTFLQYLLQRNEMPKYCVYTLPPSAVDSIAREFRQFGFPVSLLDLRAGSKSNQLIPYQINLIVHDHLRMNRMDEHLRAISSSLIFIVDEFHKTLNKTIRTSIALEVSRLASNFIVLSGTLIKDNNPDDLIGWLKLLVPFEVSTDNYWVAIGSLVSKKVSTNVVVIRTDIEPIMTESQLAHYRQLVPSKLGGIASSINLSEAVKFCYSVITHRMVADAIDWIMRGEIPFIIANNVDHQDEIERLLAEAGITPVAKIGKNVSLTLTPSDSTPYRAITTTIRHSAGYTLTKCRITLTSVYFSNEATREQLLGRTNRAGQPAPTVEWIVYHTGILTYIWKNYEHARTLAQVLKGFASDIETNVETVLAQMN